MPYIKKLCLADIINIYIPISLLGLNYILYNSLGVLELKTLLRIVAMSSIFTGWFIYKQRQVNFFHILLFIMLLIQCFLHGEDSVNLVAIVCIGIFIDNKTEKVVNACYQINIVLVIVMLFLMLAGVVNNYSYISSTGRFRTTLGFDNPNVASLFYSSAIMLYLIRRNSIKVLNIALSIVAATVTYHFTDSRTPFITMLFLCLLLVALSIRAYKINFIICKMCKYFINILFLVNAASFWFVDKMMFLDRITSGRIYQFSRMVHELGIKGFIFGGVTATTDNFYYMFLYSYGILLYIIFAIIINKAVNQCIRENRSKEVAFITSMFVMGLMESSLFRVEIIIAIVAWKLIFALAFKENIVTYYSIKK